MNVRAVIKTKIKNGSMSLEDAKQMAIDNGLGEDFIEEIEELFLGMQRKQITDAIPSDDEEDEEDWEEEYQEEEDY